jgi:hypothetical protein
VTRLKWKRDLVCLEIVLLLTQDGCVVCAERTAGSDVVLDTPNGTPRRRVSCGISFLVYLEIVLVSVQDRCMVCVKRTKG